MIRQLSKIALKSLKKTVGNLIVVAMKYSSSKYRPLIIRKGTSDAAVFRQIFFQRDYRLPIKINPKVIVDGGANVGYASIWFAHQYPKALIIAIEPEESNYEILKENTKQYSNIKTIKAGLWHKNSYLKILDSELGKWAFMTKEVKSNEEYDIKAITIDEILKRYQCKRIDILKLDIEGAEKELFSKNYENWLEKVNLLIIELHEDLKKGCTKIFYDAIKKHKWKESKQGENIILVKQS